MTIPPATESRVREASCYHGIRPKKQKEEEEDNFLQSEAVLKFFCQSIPDPTKSSRTVVGCTPLQSSCSIVPTDGVSVTKSGSASTSSLSLPSTSALHENNIKELTSSSKEAFSD